MPTKKETREQIDDQIAHWHRQGLCPKEIAPKVGLSPKTIGDHLTDLGLRSIGILEEYPVPAATNKFLERYFNDPTTDGYKYLHGET